MGAAVIQDGTVRPGLHEGLQDLSVPSGHILYQRVQLSVRKGPGAAFPELDVGVEVQAVIPAPPERLHLLCPHLHRISLL